LKAFQAFGWETEKNLGYLVKGKQLSHFPRHLGKVKQEDSRYIQFIEKLIINTAAVWRLFPSKTVAALSPKPFSVTDITEFSTEAKDTCTCGPKM